MVVVLTSRTGRQSSKLAWGGVGEDKGNHLFEKEEHGKQRSANHVFTFQPPDCVCHKRDRHWERGFI